MIIIDYYKELPEYKKIQFRQQAMAITGWSRSTFFYKMQHGRLNKLEIDALEELIRNISYDRKD